MALRYCTSKIQDFEDILDCRSLGFRGEALASAAELAGGLVITTRVEGEKTASACTCDRAGRVVERKRVGAPLGTTVRVSDFFKHLPVRREVSLCFPPPPIYAFSFLSEEPLSDFDVER